MYHEINVFNSINNHFLKASNRTTVIFEPTELVATGGDGTLALDSVRGPQNSTSTVCQSARRNAVDCAYYAGTCSSSIIIYTGNDSAGINKLEYILCHLPIIGEHRGKFPLRQALSTSADSLSASLLNLLGLPALSCS